MVLERTIAFLGGLIALVIWLMISFIKKKPLSRKIIISLFIMYITVVVSITVFPLIIDPEMMVKTDKSIILIPFSTITDLLANATIHTIILQIFGNILMAVPYGVIIPLIVKRKRWYNYLIYTLAFPVTVELTQLVMCLSTNSFYRTIDIDDVILNSIGIVIGYGIYKILPRFVKDYFGNKHIDINENVRI